MDLILYPDPKITPDELVVELMKQMPPEFDETIWIFPFQYKRKMQGFKETCTRLENVFKLLKMRKVKVGIASYRINWIDNFGEDCRKFSTEKLMWISDENTHNYDTFQPFGGWTKPSCKKMEDFS